MPDASDMISPLDYRFYAPNPAAVEALGPYFSERAYLRHLSQVEVALVRVLARRGICGDAAVGEVERAVVQITPEDVRAEQLRVRHPLMALVNCIRQRVSEPTRPFVHFTATTNDIVCSADALRHKRFAQQVLLPRLIALQRTLIGLARRERDTVQIGRTHGQHAEPITFGFAVAQFVSRLGRMILRLRDTAADLRGKMAGAVGSYNALSLFVDDPEAFEADVMTELGLAASPISTQIVEAEFLVDHVHSLVAAFGIIANVADDMRQLHRSEIAEVEEFYGESHVGSSTMPHKRNPTRLEHVKSLWKTFMPRMVTLYTDQISEHQRDLTNFESTLFAAEIACGLYVAAEMLESTLRELQVRHDAIARNVAAAASVASAEPAHLLLSWRGFRDGHEAVRRLSRDAVAQRRDLRELLFADPQLRDFLDTLTPAQRALLADPSKYTGIATAKTERVCAHWEEAMNRLEAELCAPGARSDRC